MPTGVYKRTKEYCKIMSKALKGRKFSKKWKQNISKARKGMIFSEEHRKNMSIAFKGKIPWIKGKTHSEKTKKKMSKIIRKRYKENPNFGYQKGHPFYKGGEKGWFKKGIIPWNKEKPFKAMQGKNNPRWNNGQYISRGYFYITCPAHPFKDKRGYIRRSRLVMEKSLRRCLTPKEVVHHINGIKDDDRIKNLKLFKNNSEHKKFHWFLKKSNNK